MYSQISIQVCIMNYAIRIGILNLEMGLIRPANITTGPESSFISHAVVGFHDDAT